MRKAITMGTPRCLNELRDSASFLFVQAVITRFA